MDTPKITFEQIEQMASQGDVPGYIVLEMIERIKKAQYAVEEGLPIVRGILNSLRDEANAKDRQIAALKEHILDEATLLTCIDAANLIMTYSRETYIGHRVRKVEVALSPAQWQKFVDLGVKLKNIHASQYAIKSDSL